MYSAVESFASSSLSSAAASACHDILRDLAPLLSNGSSISTNISSAPRWSDYEAPRPAYIVHVAEELDVAKTVKYCNDRQLKFLAQSGGHGAADTFDLGEHGVVINLRGLNSMVFSEAKDRVTIGGGTLNSEWVNASLAHGRQALNGGCNCVGVLGATLGGGLSKWMGHYGMPVDNVLSANIVTADGDLVTASPTHNKDLLWAVLGAGPNFGIVTSVIMGAFPLIDNGVVWAGELIFSGDKLESFIEALNHIVLTEDMSIHWGFGFRENGPVITAQVTYTRADAQRGRDAFRALYDLEPDHDDTALVEYNHINDGSDFLCEDGGRKPAWFTGLRHFEYPTFQTIWDEFVAFVPDSGLYGTTILIECYSNFALRQKDVSSASYAHRDINYYAIIIFGYDDQSLDPVAESFGSRVRELWRSTSGFTQQRTYINFAHGDDSLVDIYGESLDRLRQLKSKWDPHMKFDQWFPITPAKTLSEIGQ